MQRQDGERFVKQVYFDQARPRLTRLASRLVEDAAAVVDEAGSIFDGMLPTMAYVDKPHHPFASALFICSANLSLYLALKHRGVDVHDFGRALLTGLAKAPIPVPPREDDEALKARAAQLEIIAAESQRAAGPGEDVLEAVPGDGEFEWGYNVTSCAICQSASRYGAMDLVPYLCAVDDVMSDKGNQGLRRTGSIAVGASHCDFRYKREGEPKRLAPQYPEKIRVLEEG